MFLDRGGYDATQTTKTTYEVTQKTDHAAFVDGVVTYAVLSEAAGAYALVAGSISGTTFTVTEYYGGSGGNVIPSFSGSLTILSSAPAEILERGHGKFAIIVWGQSNAVGAGGVVDPRLEYATPDITDFVYQSFTFAGAPVDADLDGESVIAGFPLHWKGENLTSQTVSPVYHAAQSLRRDEGYISLEILAGAETSTSYNAGDWVKGGAHYERLVTMSILFHQQNPDNRILCQYWAMGESDAIAGVSEATMAAHIDLEWDNFRADVEAGVPGLDMSRTPFILSTMPDIMLVTEPVNGPPVQAAIVDTPNRIPFSSVMDISGLGNTDAFHTDLDGIRTIGRTLFVPAYREALGNMLDLSASAVITTTFDEITNTVAASAATSSSMAIATTFDEITNTMAGSYTVIDAAALATTFDEITNTVTVDDLPSIALELLLQKNVGVTLSGSNVTIWADQSGGNNHNATAASSHPQTDSEGVAFDGTMQMLFANSPSLVDQSDILDTNPGGGFTLIMDITSTIETGQNSFGNILTIGDVYYMAGFPDPTIYQFGASFATNVTSGSIVVAAGTRKTMAAIYDPVNDSLTLVIDGVIDVTETRLADTYVATSAIILGAHSGGFRFKGVMHNIAIAKRALTLSEVNQVIADDFIT